ncbi:hypothetical protein DWF00_21970 [Bosea caraganae]|uniref:Uncharacterized protein n=1 Tax=Bosea caraganae TaxID=2763117 RepID=A0A370L5R2_9HYPH|nr:hypothetical protein [Bosea caraganae]RDJ23303.1 hypothetical protein DWF00_21970 [Bosea caraganae]RDJ24584.1 hypothetical protein DWE98_12925 [Bosea caraganae]
MSRPTIDTKKSYDLIAARLLLVGIRLVLREHAQELFDLWFSGEAKDVEVFDNQKWADYMRADKGLEGQIDEHLVRYAAFVRDEAQSAGKVLADGRVSLPFQPYKTQFHAEVGDASGGYVTGYAVLHGSNRDAGDFQMSGTVSIEPKRGDASKLFVKFTNNLLVFNDKVDPNYRYSSDVTFERLALNMSRALQARRPKSFIIRIAWSEPGPWVYEIPAQSPKAVPGWLKSFDRGFK